MAWDNLYIVIAGLFVMMLAIEMLSGNLAWEYAPPEGLWGRAYASDGNTVFVGLRGGKLAALDVEQGKVRWQQIIGPNVQAPPLVHEGVVYVSTTFVGPGLDGDARGKAKLVALDGRDGSILWEFVSESYILQTPAIHNERIYTGGGYYDPSVEVDEGGPLKVYALSRQDGLLQWVYSSVDGYVKALYATDEVVVFIAYQDFANGLDVNTGELIWRKDTGNWVPSLSGFENVIYYGSANTMVHAVRADTGDTLWTYNIEGGSFNYALGKPLRIADELYFLSQQGDLIALNAVDGSFQWSLPTGITSRVGISVAGNWLFIGDQEGKIYAYHSGAIPP